MDILIKNMEMPKKDDIVIMTLDSNGRVNVFEEDCFLYYCLKQKCMDCVRQ